VLERLSKSEEPRHAIQARHRDRGTSIAGEGPSKTSFYSEILNQKTIAVTIEKV